MKKCKSCQKEIDKKASVCPYCRSKQVSKTVQIITGIIIIVVIFGVIGVMSGGSKDNSSTQKANDNPKQVQQQAQEPTIVEATTLIGDFDKNKLAANDKYKGKIVQTTAFITNISNDITGSYYLSLKPNNEQYYYGTTVTCYFTDKDELTSLSNGQSVIVQGTMDEMTLGIISIKDCELVK